MLWWLTRRRLKSYSSKEREEAAAELISKKAVKPLISELRGLELRDEAAKILVRMGTDAVEPLLSLFADPDLELRRRVILILGEIGDAKSVDPLLQVLNGNEEKLKGAAIEGLGKMEDVRCLDALASLVHHRDYSIKTSSIESLAKAKKGGAERLLAAIDPNKYDSELKRGVEKICDPVVVDSLIQLLDSNHYGDAAANALGAIKDKKAADALFNAYKKGNLSSSAALALGEMDDPRAIEPLIHCLQEGSANQWRSFARALGRFNDPRSAEPLGNYLKYVMRSLNSAGSSIATELQTVEEMRPLVKSIGDTGNPAGVKHLEEVLRYIYECLERFDRYRKKDWDQKNLEDELVKLRCEIVQAFRKLKAFESVLSMDVLQDPSPKVRSEAARSIAENPVQHARESLNLAMVQESDPEASVSIAYALKMLDLQLQNLYETETQQEPVQAVRSKPMKAAEVVQNTDQDIDEHDLQAIAEYWNHQAKEWWGNQPASREQATCDRCNIFIPRNRGYLHGSSLICSRCCDKSLNSETIENLQRDRNFLGADVIEKAREFAGVSSASQSRSQQIEFGPGVMVLNFPAGWENRSENHLKLISHLHSAGVYPLVKVFTMKPALSEAKYARLIVITGESGEIEKISKVFYKPEAENFVAQYFKKNWDAINPQSSISNVAEPNHGLDLAGFEKAMRPVREGSYQVEFVMDCTIQPVLTSEKQVVRIDVANLREICAGFVDFEPGREGVEVAFDLLQRWNPDLFQKMAQLRPNVAMSCVSSSTLDGLVQSLKKHRETKQSDCDLVLQHGEFEIATRSSGTSKRVPVILATFHKKQQDEVTVLTSNQITLRPV